MVVPNGPETGKPRESAPKPAVAQDSASWLANLAGLEDAVASGRTCLPAESRSPSRANPAVHSERSGVDTRSEGPLRLTFSAHTFVDGLGSEG